MAASSADSPSTAGAVMRAMLRPCAIASTLPAEARSLGVGDADSSQHPMHVNLQGAAAVFQVL